MWKKHIAILLACQFFWSLCMAYSVSSSRNIVHYHYPAPPQGERLELPTFSTDQQNTHEFLPVQQKSFRNFPQQNYRYQQPQQQHQQYQGHSNAVTPFAGHTSSESIRLPLQLGVSSINVGPLPLSEGVSYSSRPGLTSYGTPYPQRI